MRYRFRDIPDLLDSQPGRRHLMTAVSLRLWPLARLFATLWRRTVIRRTRLTVVIGSLGKTTTTRAIRVAFGLAPEPRPSNSLTALAVGVLAIRPRTRRAVFEVGIDGPGPMRKYASMMRPDVVVVMSVASEHGRTFGSLENTAREKARMVEALSPNGTAVLNADDPRVAAMRELTRGRVLTFGFGPGAYVRATSAELNWPHGTRVTLEVGGVQRTLETRLVSQTMVYPILAAIAVAVAEKLPLEPVFDALTQLESTPMRMDVRQLASGAILIRDEFKAPLESIERAFELLERAPAERRIAFIGDVSEPPRQQGELYRELGGRLAGFCDELVIASRMYRSYLTGAGRAGMARKAISDVSADPLAAARALRDRLQPGDVVLVKGRDSQRFERISLVLMGEEVRCELRRCRALDRCSACAMRTRGWDGVRGQELLWG